jgi:Metal-dependent amidase/aminoacylase/carboxypeptidase
VVRARCSRPDFTTGSANRLFALGFHDKADVQAGHIAVTEGYTSANVDSLDVTVRGVGGHGAYPHKIKDPIVLSAEIINAWQTIVSRENNPLDPLVVTWCNSRWDKAQHHSGRSENALNRAQLQKGSSRQGAGRN